MRFRRILPLLAALLLSESAAQRLFAFDDAKPVVRTALPQDHEYQRQLRAYLATLTADDFAHGVTERLGAPPSSADPENQYRDFIFTQLGPPLVGSKRGAPAVNAPPKLFTLGEIETAAGVLRPPVYPEALISLVEWDYAGNVYRQNRGLKLRAFVVAAIKLIMLDDYLDRTPENCRADFMAYQLVQIGAPYPSVEELLPAEVCGAYQTGLKKLARRIIGWGPKGDEIHQDLIAPVGLWYAARACRDPELDRDVEAYARALFTDPRYFHPAGYFVERGGYDAGFQGSCNFFAAWAALAGQWPFAKDAIDRAYRLRAHVLLPEPDGTWTGPTHFNTRLSSPANIDQWEWGQMRDYCASLVTDEAAHLVTLPAADALANAAAARAGEFNRQIAENPVKSGNGAAETPYTYLQNDEIGSTPWLWRLWDNFNFPASLNFGHEFYPRGAYARRRKLEAENSPLLKSPFLRGESFVRDFDRAFMVARQKDYAAIVHTGSVGDPAMHDRAGQFAGPLGLGGGQLSAFWTPATGCVVLGRRAGMSKGKSFDDLAQWRLWPIHAVSGSTTGGQAFTTARILEPEVVSEIAADSAAVIARGTIPANPFGQGPALAGRIDYHRTFRLEADGVRIETRLDGDSRDQIAELYETIPIYLRDAQRQPNAVPTTIEFRSNDAWSPAADQWCEQVTMVRLSRFNGVVEIVFDQPRRVKLSSAEWSDTWFTRATCRNLMIDLLDLPDQPQAVKETSVAYRLRAMAQ